MQLKMSLKEFLTKHKTLIEGIAAGLIVTLIVTLISSSILCSFFCQPKTTIEGVITQDGKPVNNVNIIINGHEYVTGTDGKYVISDIQVEQGMTFNVSLPPIPPIKYDYHYYLGIEPENMFQRELNDGKFKQIHIHFKLTEEESNNNLRLFLDTLEGTHEWERRSIPYFKMKVKIRSLRGDWIDLGEYMFGESPDVCEEREITIDNRFIDPGENIILFENANPEWEGYWVHWDSLKLEVIGGHTIWELGINDQSSDEFFNPWKLNCMFE